MGDLGILIIWCGKDFPLTWNWRVWSSTFNSALMQSPSWNEMPIIKNIFIKSHNF
jgi:hypothetical protein